MQRARIERMASKKWRGSIRIIISAAIYNLSCFGHGCNAAWAGGALGGGGWLAALPAAPFLALLADAKGRRAGAGAVCLCFIVSGWLCSWSARGVWAGRAAAGAGGAGALALAPLYCAEIAPGNKGLAAMPALATSCGILFAYTAGPLLPAQTLPLWMALPPVVLLLSLLWLPETPAFLISVGRMQDAAKVICWLNGSDFREDMTDIIEEQEVRIRTNDCYGADATRSDDDTFQPMLKSRGLDITPDRKGDTSSCRELFFQRRNRRALFSLCVVLCIAAGSGAGAIGSFGAGLLRNSADHTPLAVLALDRSENAINQYINTPHVQWHRWMPGPLLCSATLVLGAAIALSTLDKIGRKMLLISSCSGLACCLAVFGAYCDPRVPLPWTHLNFFSRTRQNLPLGYNHSVSIKEFPDNDSRDVNGLVIKDNKTLNQSLTQNKTFEIYGLRIDDLKDEGDDALSPATILLSLVLFLYNLGLGSVPYVLVSELFSLNARSMASSFLVSWMWMISFLLLRYYGRAATFLGLHGTYYLSAVITLLGSVYIYLTIPETKGKSQDQIDEILRGGFFLGQNKNMKQEEVPCFELNCYTNSA